MFVIELAYIGYDKLWRCEFYNNVSVKEKGQNNTLNQLKLKVNYTYRKDEKIGTNFEPSHDEDVINKAYVDKKLSRKEGHLSLMEKDYNEFKMRNDKQSEEAIERAVKTTIQNLCDKGLFDKHDNADEVLKNYLLIDEANEKRRPDS